MFILMLVVGGFIVFIEVMFFWFLGMIVDLLEILELEMFFFDNVWILFGMVVFVFVIWMVSNVLMVLVEE